MRFWNWSVETYRRPGVERLLLSLQDECGLSVNLLLWCLWCARSFETPQEIDIRKAEDITRRWSAEITGPLRGARRSLKSPPPQADAGMASALRDRLKECELAAERIEQDMLEALARANLAPASAGGANMETRARRALAAYAKLQGAARRQGFSVTLLETLIELTFQQSESDVGGVG